MESCSIVLCVTISCNFLEPLKPFCGTLFAIFKVLIYSVNRAAFFFFRNVDNNILKRTVSKTRERERESTFNSKSVKLSDVSVKRTDGKLKSSPTRRDNTKTVLNLKYSVLYPNKIQLFHGKFKRRNVVHMAVEYSCIT